MATAYPQIPYGWADFEAMRRERCLYVDKTRFLHRAGARAPCLPDPAAREAQVQLRQYLADPPLARQYPAVQFTGLAIVFHGWEMVFSDAVA